MKKLIFCMLILGSLLGNASNLKISEPILYTENETAFALLNISWENSWHNDTNHDAVWLFFKFLRGDNGFQHVSLMNEGHTVTMVHGISETDLNFDVPADRLGVFIYPKSKYRGKVSITVKIYLDKESYNRINPRSAHFSAYALEMVFIPQGGFTLGDEDSSSVRFGSLYRSDNKGKYGGTFSLKEEKQSIEISPQKNHLYYQAPTGYEGDQKGIIPADFPKGVDAFYIMKYEPSQGQYADFLNSLSESQSQNRVNFGGKNYYQDRGSIKVEKGRYFAETPAAPCNFMSWDDAMAYADWSGLRPMTEFEFTKAARGPAKPIVNGFPWGTASKEKIQRMVASNGEVKMLNQWSEAQLSNDNKEVFGASYYWVMDLAGSLWERVITIGDEKGRNFKGTHGDGRLSGYGFATNEDWPKGIEESGGFGFRGGGFYGYGRDYHDYNPFSPIAYRPYGGWSGGNRVKAYGARFVRSAP